MSRLSALLVLCALVLPAADGAAAPTASPAEAARKLRAKDPARLLERPEKQPTKTIEGATPTNTEDAARNLLKGPISDVGGNKPDGGASRPPAAAPETDEAFGAFQQGYYLTALAYALETAVNGDPPSQALIGFLYENGLGVARDLEIAADWYRFAAGRGDREAQFRLGLMHLDGNGVTKDRARAFDLFEQAAAQGQPKAIYNLGLLYLTGISRKRDVERAAELFAKAADADISDAQYALALMHEQGVGVPRDVIKATQWMARAARNGFVDAQVEYAIRLANAKGIARDDVAAVAWFERAARLGSPIAMNRLAHMLSVGRGRTADPVEAGKWHMIAKRMGLSDLHLDGFVEALPEDVRQQAVDRAATWRLR